MADKAHHTRLAAGRPSRRKPRRLRDVHPTRRGLVLAWWGFTATFGGLRLLTWAITSTSPAWAT